HDGADGWRRCRDRQGAAKILRARPLDPGTARQLSLAAGAARSRLLLDLRQAGGVGHSGTAAADDPFDDRVTVVRVLLRARVRGDRRPRRQPLAGHADLYPW